MQQFSSKRVLSVNDVWNSTEMTLCKKDFNAGRDWWISALNLITDCTTVKIMVGKMRQRILLQNPLTSTQSTKNSQTIILTMNTTFPTIFLSLCTSLFGAFLALRPHLTLYQYSLNSLETTFYSWKLTLPHNEIIVWTEGITVLQTSKKSVKVGLIRYTLLWIQSCTSAVKTGSKSNSLQQWTKTPFTQYRYQCGSIT